MNIFDKIRLELNSSKEKARRALQVLDGVLLSDGSIARFESGAYFCLKQSDKLGTVDHTDWILDVIEHLATLNIYPKAGYPKPFSIISHGKTLTGSVLYTEITNELLAHYNRWYNGGSKQVPADLTLTPVSLAHWFMGDGSSHREGRPGHGVGSTDVSLATYCFNEESISILRQSLESLRLSTRLTVIHQNGRIYTRLCIRRSDSGYFMDLVKDYITPSYLYKVKMPY